MFRHESRGDHCCHTGRPSRPAGSLRIRQPHTGYGRAGYIKDSLADSLKRMFGFRNIAVHDDQSLQLPIVVAIIQRHLDDFPRYSQALLLRDGQSS